MTESKPKTPSHPHFCKRIVKDIKDEQEGYEHYMAMSKKAKCSCIRTKYQRMAKDERRHKRELQAIKRKVC